MTDVDLMKKAFPQHTQIGGNHYTKFTKNNLSFFQGNVIKYVCRYLKKGGEQDLEKIKHYCDLEILKLKDARKRK